MLGTTDRRKDRNTCRPRNEQIEMLVCLIIHSAIFSYMSGGALPLRILYTYFTKALVETSTASILAACSLFYWVVPTTGTYLLPVPESTFSFQ
jgi:hypothetical protein